MGKKIVFLADCLVTQKAGIHFYTKQFIDKVIAQYPDNQYYTVLPYSYGELEINEIVVPIKRWIPLHFRLRTFHSIPKAIKKINPDVVIEMAHFGPFNLPDSIKRATVIYDLTPVYYPEWHDKLSHYFHRILLPKVVNKSTYLIAISEQTKKDLIRFNSGAKNKTLIAYPSMSDEKSNSEQHSNSPLKVDKYLLSVGTIEPRKNYVTLIKAFDKLAAKFPYLKLRLVGYKGWKSENVFELIERSSYKDRIILEGYTTPERLESLYVHATAFVFPSLYEGFGMPVLEALSHDLPVVCSDIPTSREICGSAALYFETLDDRALVEKTYSILQNEELRQTYIQKSRNRFIEFNQPKLNLDELFT